MSLLNGKLPRRMAAALGSACFLGGLALAAAPADAGLYLALRVNPANIPSGVSQSGSITSGYSITAPSGTSTTLSLQLVALVTTGSTTTPAGANGYLNIVRGAVRTTAATSGTFTGTTGFSFTNTGFQNTAPLAGTPVAGGIGPQSGTFSSSDSTNATADRTRFESIFAAVATSNTSTGTAVPLGLAAGTGETVVGSFTGVVNGTGSLSIAAVGPNGLGTGATGTNAVATSLATYFEAFNPNNLSAAQTSGIISNPLNVTFGSAGPTIVLFDFNGDGVFDTGDIDPFVAALGDPDQYVADNTAAFQATYGVPLTVALLNSAVGNYDGNGIFDTGAIDPFVNAIGGGSSVAAPSVQGVVPEPASLGALALCVPLVTRRRR